MSTLKRRLLVGNFDFEHTIVFGNDAPRPAVLRRIVAELAPVWIAAAREGDVLWCPEPIDPAFFERLQAHGLPRICPVSRFDDVPAGLELVPWGWTDDVIRWGKSVGALTDAPPLESVRTVNSRRFSYPLERELGVGLQGAAIAHTLPGLFEAIDRLPHPDAGCVVKAEFSHASRERFRHRGGDQKGMGGRVRSEAHGPETDRPGLPVGQTRSPQAVDRDSLSRWARRRLDRGQALFVEPWVDRVDEVGVQLTVPRNGQPRVEGVSRLLVDEAGRYRGSEFTPTLDADPHWQNAVTTALDVAGAVQQTGYFGPLGIDAMRFRDPNGDLRLRPIQDINARWTMGRLSLGLRRLLRPGERGYWLHGSSSQSTTEPTPHPTSKLREIVTSPAAIGGRPMRHGSTIWIADLT